MPTVNAPRRRNARGAHDDWAGSTPADRVAFMVDHFRQGERVLAGRAGCAQHDLHCYVLGQGSPSDGLIRQIARVAGVDPQWAATGEGWPLDPPPRAHDPGMVERLKLLLARHWGAQTPPMAQACEVTASELDAFLAGRNTPPEEVLLRLARAAPGLDLDWLLTGKGEPFPAASGEPVPPPAVEDRLDSLLLDRFRGALGAREAVTNCLGRMDRLRADTDAALQAHEAKVAEARQLAAQVLSLQVPESLRELREQIHDGVETAKGVALKTAATAVADVQSRVETLEARGEEEAGTVREKSDALLAAVAELKAMVEGLPGALAAALAGAFQPKPPGPARDAFDALADDAMLSVTEWVTYPGGHRELLEGTGARRSAGHALMRLRYRLKMPGTGPPNRYPVRHLRLYLEWLRLGPARAVCDDPLPEVFVRYAVARLGAAPGLKVAEEPAAEETAAPAAVAV